jgi:Fe-S-cluster containining protein
MQFRTEFSFIIVMWKNSYNSCGRKCCCKFPETTFPSGDKMSKLMKEVRTNFILIDRKPLKRNHVLIEEKLDDFDHM